MYFPSARESSTLSSILNAHFLLANTRLIFLYGSRTKWSRVFIAFVVVFAVIDSSGKVPASLLRGNINQLGDFDQCVNVKGSYENSSDFMSDREEIYGKYCLAAIDITLPPALHTINNLIHSHYVIKSKLADVSI